MKSILLLGILALALVGCGDGAGPNSAQPSSDSGVTRARVQVATGSDGLTIEQRNVKKRLLLDNKPGSIKYLYVISPYSGQVLMYSTVQGKVTSSGKRLSPRMVATQDGQYVESDMRGFPMNIGGRSVRTGEVLEDDGTYGDSAPYIFWWDVQGRYHQHFILDGQIIHISDQPMAVKSVTLNLETHGEPVNVSPGVKD